MRPFAIERYFARFEHVSRHLLSSSDCEPLTLADLLGLADSETLALWDDLSLGYTESPGLPLLRREIAGLYEGIAADDVLEVVPEEGIILAMRAMLEPGDHVVTTFPGYQSLYSIAEDMGCVVSRWQPRTDDGWRFDPGDLRAALRPDTKLVIVNFPHNPTGALPSIADFVETVRIVADAGAYLFSDEMYRWLEPEGVARLPSACEVYPRAVALCGMSKTFSLPGLRVGWLATREEAVMERLALLKDYTTICASAPSEVLALMGLRARAGIVAANLATISANKAAVERLCAAHPERLAWTPPRAGSVALASLAVDGGVTAACERIAAEAGAMLLPSSVFDFGDGHVRLGLGRAALPEGLAAFDVWLSDNHL